jgi:DNA replicative helicase MCM subunit Mcm2 (Cdc46/Mcm family)
VVKESGIHQLYLVANSLQCVKASGDRDRGVEINEPDVRSVTSDSVDKSLHDNSEQSRSNSSSSSSSTTTIGIGRPSLVCFTPSELDSVRRIALSDGPGGSMGLLVASLCPTIFGHELVKLGLLLGNI